MRLQNDLHGLELNDGQPLSKKINDEGLMERVRDLPDGGTKRGNGDDDGDGDGRSEPVRVCEAW